MQFKETEFNSNLAEIQQTLDVKFAHVIRQKNGTYTNVHPFVKCRDFLGDVLHSVQINKSVGIYGFNFNPKKQKIYKNKLMLAIKFPTQESFNNFYNNRDKVYYFILHEMGLLSKESLITWCYKSAEQLVILEAPKFWKDSIAALSFLTFLIKCASYKLDPDKSLLEAIKDVKVEKKYWDGQTKLVPTLESDYLHDNLPIFYKNIKKLTKNLKTVSGQDTESINQVHNYSGFYSVCKHFSGEVGARLKELV